MMRAMIRFFWCSSIAAGAAALAGCTGLAKGFNGPSCSCQNPAVLRPEGVTIEEVNGVVISPFSTGVEILPGRNLVIVAINPGNFGISDSARPVYQLELDAVAGRHYSLTAKPGHGYICAYERQTATGKPDFAKSAGCAVRR